MAVATKTKTGKLSARKNSAAAPRPDGLDRTANEVAQALRLIAEPTRVKILLLIQDGELNVGALCGRLGMSQPSASHHLCILRIGQIVVARREGKCVYYGPTEFGKRVTEAAVQAIRAFV